jgi:hypothetical protein
MKHVRKPHQCELFGSQPEPAATKALPMANRTEAVLLLGRLLLEIVQAETTGAKKGGGDEQDHR